VAGTMRAHLRSYDLIVRYGGDEFVCGLQSLSVEEATKRFSQINIDLGESAASVTAGFAHRG
jgi:GGDEF domain-containing protein